jgi:2,3-bisphosphoglycerate-independent phosphoglycerate mutase
MDRNLRREKTKLAYDLIVKGIGTTTQDFCNAIQESYKHEITDEYLLAHIKQGYEITGTLKNGDAVLFVNYRNDRPLQLVRALTQEDFPEQEMQKLSITMLTMTEYDPTFVGVTPLFTKNTVIASLGEMISQAGKTQLRIAETEKYPHVTFFFNG